jgi:hypothetical protein
MLRNIELDRFYPQPQYIYRNKLLKKTQND